MDSVLGGKAVEFSGNNYYFSIQSNIFFCRRYLIANQGKYRSSERKTKSKDSAAIDWNFVSSFYR
jgi:hypothetical protein